jgi:tryptophan synthase
MKFLCGIADSFIYVVSRMGVTGVTGTISSAIPELCAKVHKYGGDTPIAVGFGVSTRADFLAIGENAEGVVIGSQIVTTLANAEPSKRAEDIKKYVASIVGKDINAPTTRQVGLDEAIGASEGDMGLSAPTAVITDEDAAKVDLVGGIEAMASEEPVNPNVSGLRPIIVVC